MSKVVVAYKVDCGYCGTDQYGYYVSDKNTLEDNLHQIALEHDDSYGYEEEEAQELIDDGMDEIEAQDIAHSNKQERVSYQFTVLLETENEDEAEKCYKHYSDYHCPSEFIPSDY